MKQGLPSGFLKRAFQLLISISLASWLLLPGSLAYASPAQQQASPSKCPTIPANFDFLHASKQELHRYLLPAAPPVSDSQAYNSWKNGVQKAVRTGGTCVNDLKITSATHNGNPVISSPLIPASGSCSGGVCSPNWEGYVAYNSSPGFNEVVGIWNVECVIGSLSPSDSVQVSWIGLGGGSPVDNQLWQVGSGWAPWMPYSHYYLWYEAVGGPYQNPSQQVFLENVSCGDQIYADLWYAPNDPTSNVAFYLTDNGQPYRNYAPAGFASGQFSAEWIDERSGCDYNGDVYKLADYNYSQWTHAYASPDDPNAGFYSAGDLNASSFWMEDNDTTIAATSALGADLGSGNDNFLGYWEGNGSSQCG